MSMEQIGNTGNYQINSSSYGKSGPITQEQADILQTTIDNAFAEVDKQAATDKTNARTAANEQFDVEGKKQELDAAQDALDKAEAEADKYDYDNIGAHIFDWDGKGKFDEDSMTADNYAAAYRGEVDTNGDGKVDDNDANYSARQYDTLDDQDKADLDKFLQQVDDGKQFSKGDLERFDEIMEKMAKEAKSDTQDSLYDAQDQQYVANNVYQGAVYNANQAYAEAERQIDDKAADDKEAKEGEIYDNAAFGMSQDGAKTYFSELDKQNEQDKQEKYKEGGRARRASNQSTK